MKRTLAIILTVLMLLSVLPLTVYADETENQGEVEEITEGETEEITDEPETPVQKSDNYAYLYICTNQSNKISLGHVWIYIENTSGEDIMVGKYLCPAGQGVSVGTFGLTRSDGSGVYYNIEAYCGNKYNMDNFAYAKKSITESQLKKISNFILSFNFWDPMICNCGFFASMSWNLGGGSFIFPVVIFPMIMRLEMLTKGVGHDNIMYYPDRSQVYKQRGTGSSASLQLASDGSVDSVPG